MLFCCSNRSVFSREAKEAEAVVADSLSEAVSEAVSEEMLSVSINDIREVGQELTTAMENIVMSTVSDQTSIEKSELFKNIIVVK